MTYTTKGRACRRADLPEPSAGAEDEEEEEAMATRFQVQLLILLLLILLTVVMVAAAAENADRGGWVGCAANPAKAAQVTAAVAAAAAAAAARESPTARARECGRRCFLLATGGIQTLSGASLPYVACIWRTRERGILSWSRCCIADEVLAIADDHGPTAAGHRDVSLDTVDGSVRVRAHAWVVRLSSHPSPLLYHGQGELVVD